MHLSGVVKIQYLLGSQSLTDLPAGYYASYSLQALILFLNTVSLVSHDPSFGCDGRTVEVNTPLESA